LPTKAPNKNYFSALRLLVYLWVIATSISAPAQSKRPKVGLVLSGGGAKGIAHVGVLKALEEAGLTPDYITGTSMGSIVGGLYSIGYSADELEDLVNNMDWGRMLSNTIPWDKVTFEEKFYYGRYLLDLYYEDKSIKLPQGIIEGQALSELFSTLTRPVHNISDFNDFPIPFACVGADIVTGKPVVLNKGSLANAMRASMAIPSVFTPVKIDDHLLVDGGLLRNMPVQEVLDMGADIVIGVFVSSDLDPEEKLTSAIAILFQSTFISSAFDTREQLALCDILVEPDLEDFSSGSFQSSDQIMEKGKEAGQKYLEVFKQLADSLDRLGPPRKVLKPEIEQKYVFDRLEITGNQVVPDEFVIGKMKIKYGDTVSIEHLERQLEIIYGTQYFEKLWYEILRGEETVLRIHITERPKIQLRFSYHYDSDRKGGVVGNVTMRNVVLNRSRLIFEANLATNPAASVDYFKYLGRKQNLALRFNGLYHNQELPAYDSVGNVEGIFRDRFIASALTLQTTNVQSSTLGVKVQWASSILKPQIADGTIRAISKLTYNNTSFTFFHRFNNHDDRYFPTRGLRTNLELSTTTGNSGSVTLGDTLTIEDPEAVLQLSGISSLLVDINPVIPLGNRVSLLSKFRMKVSSLDNDLLNFNEYDFIGGFLPGLVSSNEYWGVGVNEYVLSNYFFGKVGLQFEVKRNLFLQTIVNYLDTEYPMVWVYPDADIGRVGTENRTFSFGALVGIRSPVGPLSVAVAKDQNKSDWRAGLILGFYF